MLTFCCCTWRGTVAGIYEGTTPPEQTRSNAGYQCLCVYKEQNGNGPLSCRMVSHSPNTGFNDTLDMQLTPGYLQSCLGSELPHRLRGALRGRLCGNGRPPSFPWSTTACRTSLTTRISRNRPVCADQHLHWLEPSVVSAACGTNRRGRFRTAACLLWATWREPLAMVPPAIANGFAEPVL
jgi:hypothetical protein